MFAATLTLTISAVDKVMNRINQDNFGSEYNYTSDTEEIVLLIRHSVDSRNGVPVKRHNLFVERTVFATVTVPEQYWSSTITLRDQKGSGPTILLANWVGLATLFATLDQDFVLGVN